MNFDILKVFKTPGWGYKLIIVLAFVMPGLAYIYCAKYDLFIKLDFFKVVLLSIMFSLPPLYFYVFSISLFTKFVPPVSKLIEEEMDCYGSLEKDDVRKGWKEKTEGLKFFFSNIEIVIGSFISLVVTYSTVIGIKVFDQIHNTSSLGAIIDQLNPFLHDYLISIIILYSIFVVFALLVVPLLKKNSKHKEKLMSD